MNIKYRKKKGLNLYNVILFLLFCSVLTMRPTALGEKYSIISVAISIVTVIVYIIINNNYKSLIRNHKNDLMMIGVFIFWFYCGLQSLIMNSSNIEFSIKAIIINITIIGVFYIILSNDKLNYKFFRTMIIILSLFCISYYITLGLSLFLGYDRLYLFKINIKGYWNSGSVYFPFTIEYNSIAVNGFPVIRSLTFFREAGITQMFYLWGFFVSNIYFKRIKLIKIIMFFGTISCFSTAGFIIFIVVFLMYILINIKKYKFKSVISIVILLTFTLLFMNTKGISIKDKATESISDRTSAILDGSHLLFENPLFGNGFYNSTVGTTIGINFISSLYMIGLVGGVLYFLIFLLKFINTNNKKIFILGVSPIIITLLFSQPLIESPLIFIMLLANYDIKEKFINKEKSNDILIDNRK